jgi:hypothetical protein
MTDLLLDNWKAKPRKTETPTAPRQRVGLAVLEQ